MEQIDVDQQSRFRKIGSISAIVILIVFAAELVVVAIHGLPPVFGSAEDWLKALQRDRLLGLAQTFGLDIVAVIFHAPLYVALVFFLRSYRKGYPTLILSAAFAFIGMAVYFSSNATFSMLYLSDQLSAATNDAQRASVIESAKTAMAVYWNGTGYDIATNFAGIAGILVSIVMLRSKIFSRATAIIGIAGNALELGPPAILMPPIYLKIDPIAVAIGGLLLLFWYMAIGIKLWRGPVEELRRGKGTPEHLPPGA
jgi:hypothetical protein